jgi:hypothetical protein
VPDDECADRLPPPEATRDPPDDEDELDDDVPRGTARCPWSAQALARPDP